MHLFERHHAPLHFAIFMVWLCLAVCIPLKSAHAVSEPIPINVEIDQDVVYCSIGPIPKSEYIQQALQEGTTITFSWEFIVDEVFNYWLNQNAGTVTISRQVIPDLVSKTWILKDGSNSMERRVFSLDQAMAFLLQLDHFPVLDHSLLQAENIYLMRVKLHINEGELSPSWWAETTRFGKTMATQEFTFP
ncbi:MAG: DUF4390 domain-containing protein [Mariprofundaceae bacterium]